MNDIHLTRIIPNDLLVGSSESLKDEENLSLLHPSRMHISIIPDVLGGIDDLFDTWNPQSDVHGCNTSKVEGFQRHLSAGLPDALSTKGPYS